MKNGALSIIGVATLVCCTGLSASVMASERLEFAPAPAWIESTSTTDSEKSTDAPVRYLLTDQQVNLTADTIETYNRTVLKIQTPQGLNFASQVALAWQPETDTLIVHTLQVRRGNQTLSLLTGSDSFTILRRENELEMSALNGVLTAVYQPAGLQVGDIIDFAYSVKHTDAVFPQAVETIAGDMLNVQTRQGQLRIRWPDSLPLRWQATEFLTDLKETRQSGFHELRVDLHDLTPLTQPKLAPARFYANRHVELSSYKSWSEISRQFAPLFKRAAMLSPSSPLHAEVVRIRAQSDDPVKRASAALRLVQDQIRYVQISLNNGRLIPADVDTTWTRRFGDCKAKTAMLLSLLSELGIDAEAVLVSSTFGDGLNQRLPRAAWFDHVLVRATINGNIYWLDGTRTGDRQLDANDVPAFHWSLPVNDAGSELVRMDVPAPTSPFVATNIKIDARQGIYSTVLINAETIFRKSLATQLQLALASLPADQRDAALRQFWQRNDYWSDNFVDLKISSVSAQYDDAIGNVTIAMQATATMKWDNGHHWLSALKLAQSVDLKREPSPYQDAPYLVSHPAYGRTTEIIQLPNNGNGFGVVYSLTERTIGGTHYHLESNIKDGVMTAISSARSVAAEFAANEAVTVEKDMTALSRASAYLQAPTNYTLTAADQRATLEASPATAEQYIQRGNTYLNNRQFDDAISDFSASIKLDPKSAMAYANRSIAYAWKMNADAASADIKTAQQLDPRNPVAYRALGLMAMQRQDCNAVIKHITTALVYDPGNEFALEMRLRCYFLTKRAAESIVDGKTLTLLHPHNLSGWELLLGAQAIVGTRQESLDTIEDMLAALPDSVGAHYDAATQYSRLGLRDHALREFAQSIAQQPTMLAYLGRAKAQRLTNLKARRSDIEAALKLEPNNAIAHFELAKVQSAAGEFSGALQTLDQLIRQEPGNDKYLAHRAAILLKNNQSQKAATDIEVVMNHASPTSLNELCWQLAADNIALEHALAACEAALKLESDPNDAVSILDSRAFVFLRLGRFNDALRDYDTVLLKEPETATSLAGRSIAKRNLGDVHGAAEDLANVTAASPARVDDFMDYGFAF
jgi:tetratricopeptide (TPR) repeat protein